MTPKQKIDKLLDQLSPDELKELISYIENQYKVKSKNDKPKKILFSREDVKKATKDDTEVNKVMQRVDYYISSKTITVTIKVIREGLEINCIMPLKHFDLEDSIRVFTEMLNKDKRRHTKESRKMILDVLQIVKQNKEKESDNDE